MRETGWDEDSDDALRAAVEKRTGHGLTGEDSEAVVDVALLWWRENDGDLADGLVAAPAGLADDGTIWLLTPKMGRDGHVEPSDIAEAATTAGLVQRASVPAGVNWNGTRLEIPRNSR